MKIVWLDADISGTTTIQNYIASGQVQAFRCPSFRDCEAAMWALYRKQITADMVVLDTVDAVANVARQDLVMEPSQTRALPIWDNREKLVAGRPDYYKTADVVNRLTRPLRELGIPVVFVCHERGRTDPMSNAEKYVPNLQREILSNLFSFADAIVRLYPSPYPFDYGGQNIPTGTRLLLLSATGDSAAGVRVPQDKPPAPPFIVVGENDPYSFGRFVQAIGGVVPNVTVLYGPPKIGKTRFVATACNS